MIMKLRLFGILMVFVALGMFSCDKIEPPYKQSGGEVGDGTTRKVLLEDYTGHTCVNCPSAAKVALELKEIYGENIILMGVHAGFFAMPQVSPFLMDLRTEAGETWDTFFGISLAGNPKGMINRTSTGGIYYYNKGEWSSKVASIIEDKARAKLAIDVAYNNTSRKLELKVTAEFLKTLSGAAKLQVLILEDSIVGAQRNNDVNIGPPVIEDYVHRHVLRGDINGSWGEQIGSNSGETVGSVIEKTYSYDVNPEWVDKHCSIIAYLYYAAGYEIIQVEEAHLIP